MLKLRGDGGLKQVRRKDGSVIRNSWMLVLNFMDTNTGKRKQKYRPFKGTKKEARRALENFRREMEEGLRFDADTVTFGAYSKQWIDARESSGEFAPATIKRNKEVLAHLKRHLESSLIDPKSMPRSYASSISNLQTRESAGRQSSRPETYSAKS